MRTLTILSLSALLLSGCSEQVDKKTQVAKMPRFNDVALAKGRAYWMETCRNCHLLGVSGAPAVTDYAAWAPRIAKGKEALYKSALGGVKDHNEEIRMPPRGGNPRLSDEQVKRAVDYMVDSVDHLNKQSMR